MWTIWNVEAGNHYSNLIFKKHMGVFEKMGCLIPGS